MSYVCAYSSVQLDKSRVEREFAFQSSETYRDFFVANSFDWPFNLVVKLGREVGGGPPVHHRAAHWRHLGRSATEHEASDKQLHQLNLHVEEQRRQQKRGRHRFSCCVVDFHLFLVHLILELFCRWKLPMTWLSGQVPVVLQCPWCVQVNGILTSARAILDAGNLTVWNLDVDDQGIYECVASNVIADVITSTLLVVECQYAHSHSFRFNSGYQIGDAPLRKKIGTAVPNWNNRSNFCSAEKRLARWWWRWWWWHIIPSVSLSCPFLFCHHSFVCKTVIFKNVTADNTRAGLSRLAEHLQWPQ